MTDYKGIDVSKHQGNINWDKVKADGIQFAMIRAGIGSDIKSQDDPYFERNVKECERVGIPWGAYLYSYAMNKKQAESESRHMIRLLKGKRPQYPVAFDMEDADNYKAKRGMPDNKTLVMICDTFLNKVESEGYYVSLYASLSWLNERLTNKKLNRYDKWVAQWTSANTSSYDGTHYMWQYSSTGNVNGINGNVDMNRSYTDFHFNNKSKPQTFRYKIKTGDTLSQIAVNNNVSQKDIMDINPGIKNANTIYAGQSIKIPK